MKANPYGGVFQTAVEPILLPDFSWERKQRILVLAFRLAFGTFNRRK